MMYIGRYINSIEEFNLKRKELANALKSDIGERYFLRGKPSKDGKQRGFIPSACVHPKSDEVITVPLAIKLIINALEKFDAIEKVGKWTPEWQRHPARNREEHDVFTYVYRHKSGNTKKNIFIKIQVETDCDSPILFEGKTRINRCIGFHPSGQN